MGEEGVGLGGQLPGCLRPHADLLRWLGHPPQEPPHQGARGGQEVLRREEVRCVALRCGPVPARCSWGRGRRCVLRASRYTSPIPPPPAARPLTAAVHTSTFSTVCPMNAKRGEPRN